MLDLLQKWGEGHARELSVTDFPVSPGAIRLIEDFPLDMFIVLNEKTYEDLLPHTEETEQGIKYLNPDALIDLKKDSFREKDKIDIHALKKLQRDKG